ncbi:hypothetical protein Q2X75_000758 [Campylobacter upsaliensis]|nr:hypothetical protein [Campylobacter upsaliensis]
MAKSKRGFSFELRNSKQNTAFCVSKSGEAFSVFCFKRGAFSSHEVRTLRPRGYFKANLLRLDESRLKSSLGAKHGFLR